jgi:predicted 3-demethylubiquinone-9 3-methyltransferase (glyoxalase superfamily)
MVKLTPNFLFNAEALEAAEFYVSIFPNSHIGEVSYYPEGAPLAPGTVLAVNFVLDGHDLTAINSGETFSFNESISLRVTCHGQDEVDYYWDALVSGGSEGRCGWLTDRFGVSWQITPVELGSYLGDPDPARAQRAMGLMMQMTKIELAQFAGALTGVDGASAAEGR